LNMGLIPTSDSKMDFSPAHFTERPALMAIPIYAECC